MAKNLIPTTRTVLQQIKDQNIVFFDLKFLDLFGTLKHLVISADKIDGDAFIKGFSFDGSSIQGFQAINNRI